MLLPAVSALLLARATPAENCLRAGDGSGATACAMPRGVISVMGGGGGRGGRYEAHTALGGCEAVPGTQTAALQSGGGGDSALRASRSWRCPNSQTATIVDTLTNTSKGIQWDISVSSASSGWWTAPIVSTVRFPDHSSQRYWFGGSTSNAVDLAPTAFGSCDHAQDGLCEFKYGGDYADPSTPPNEVWTNQLVLPIWSYLADPSADAAVALVQSPLASHAPVFARLTTRVEFSRLGNGSAPATFRQQLLHTQADWRPAAGWMLQTYPEFFFPNASAQVAQFEGSGAYADYRGSGVDAAYATRLKTMNFGINWDAVFPYPFHGMWMPYAPYYGTTWENCFLHPTYDKQPSPFNVTHAWIASYYQSLREMGFHSCTYGNFFEFGWNISDTKPAAALHCSADYLPQQAACDARSQCRSNQIFWDDLEPAAVRAWEGAPDWPSEIPGKDDSHGKGTVPTGGLLRPTGCLGSPCALMDPGHPVYKAHLLKMAQTMIAEAPSSGLCVDRQDMVGGVINDRGDDGRTYFTANASKISAVGGGVAGRSSMFSVLDLLEEMGDVMHSAGKGIMVNTHTSRIDMFRNVDGIFDEHGDNPTDNMKVTALNSLAMPAVIWNHGGGKGDRFLQQHLFFGVNFMAPFPNNDHSIHDTSQKTTQDFEDYGPMFAQLRSKVWVLVAHAAEVSGGLAKANLFKTKYGYAAPVVLASPNTTAVDVTLRCGAVAAAAAGCGAIPRAHVVATLLHPGNVAPGPATFRWGADGALVFSKLPLRRGAAMVVLRDGRAAQ